ncbi:MAG: major capsid protein [Prevotella sp.]|nr:major capsid protein [Prevotella sp.]
MNTLPKELYQVIEYGLGGCTWQQFVDHYNEKYNTLEIDGFEKEPLHLNYTFAQLISTLNVTTLPTYVDIESPGYEQQTEGANGITGNIPTMKKFYRLNRVTVGEKLQLMQRFGEAALTNEMQTAFMSMLDEGTECLIKGYYNALTHQRMQIVSTGQFTINGNNNPRGLTGITIRFGMPDDNFIIIQGDRMWWTNSEHTNETEGEKSDPIGDLRNMVRNVRRKGIIGGGMHLEMSQDLYYDMLTHSKVLAAIGLAAYPILAGAEAAQEYAANMPDDSKRDILSRLIGVPLKTRDSYAFVDRISNEGGEPELTTERISNFDIRNVALIPDGKIGTIQGVSPLTLGYDEKNVARYDGGRLVLTQRANPETHSIYIESEAAQLCVPSMPQRMFISTVTE